MQRFLRNSLMAITTVMAGSLLLTSPILAADPINTNNDSGTGSTNKTGNGLTDGLNATKSTAGATGATDADSAIKKAINTMLYIVGVAAVIMIIYGGIQYVISHGDSGKIAAAKNTILYAVVGLVFAIVAYAMVNFIIKDIFK